MTDITELTALELLDWLAESTINAKNLRGLIKLGVTDTDTLRWAATAREATLIGIAGIADARHELPPLVAADDRTLIENVDVVGSEVFIRDYDRLDQWLEVAELYRSHRDAFLREKGADGGHRPRHTPWEIDAFISAGRDPEYASAMIRAAVEIGSAPDVHGYDDAMTPDLFRRLITAGIRNQAALTTYYDAGLTAADAFEIAQAGVPANVARAAAQDGLPRNQWTKLLPPIPERWIPDDGIVEPRSDTKNGMLAVPEMTWETMHELATTGWDGLSPWDLRSRKFGYKNGFCSEWTVENALRAARAGITEADIHTWVKALYTGKGGTEWWERKIPSLTGRYWGTLTATIDAILTLRGRGIRPSWIGDYRALGARSIDDAITLADAGITGALAKSLLTSHGERKYAHDPARFRSLDHALRAYRELPAGATATKR